MKKIITVCMVALGVLAMPQTSHAQGFLKKLNKGLEKVNKTLGNAGDAVNVTTGKAVKQENGVVVSNPLSKLFDVELLGAYGVSTSENYGNVELVLKVTMKAPESRIGFGGNGGGGTQTIAFDGDGNSYKMSHPSTWTTFDVTEGIPVKIVLSGNDVFEKVRKTTHFSIVKLFAHIDYEANKRGELLFKNVPIEWDVEH